MHNYTTGRNEFEMKPTVLIDGVAVRQAAMTDDNFVFYWTIDKAILRTMKDFNTENGPQITDQTIKFHHLLRM